MFARLSLFRVDGARLNDLNALKGMHLDGSKLVNTLVQCSLRQMLENGFFHADPHAGNLLAMPNGKLCYLDFGMVSYVEAEQRYSIIEAVVHMVNRNFYALARLYQRMGFIPLDVDTQPIVLALEKALPDVLNSAVSDFNFKNVIGKLGDVMYKFPFSLPPYYISIIRCLGVLEGLAMQVGAVYSMVSIRE
ncbi:AarF/ABC1/UbiB kinase family protein [archaeon]|nr:MAG: AarF/ABC1/UbiB kinase family protein [archaeon]